MALAGTALFVLSHAFLKGALFMCAGVLLHRWGSVDIGVLSGRGRVERLTGVLFVLAGIGLVGLPPFGTFLGKSLIEEAATEVHYGWVVVVFVVASGVSAAAGLRAAARVFLGWDAPVDGASPAAPGVHYETGALRSRTPLVMLVPIAVLVLVGLGVAFAPRVVDGVEQAAARFVDTPAYAERVIDGVPGAGQVGEPELDVSAGAVVAELGDDRARRRRDLPPPVLAPAPAAPRGRVAPGESGRPRPPVAALGSHRRLHRVAHLWHGPVRRDTGRCHPLTRSEP